MQTKSAIEINDSIRATGTRDVDSGTHLVIRVLAVRDDNVQTVSCAALEEDDEALASAGGCVGGLGENGAGQERWDDAGPHYGHGAALHECSTSYGHNCLLLMTFLPTLELGRT